MSFKWVELVNKYYIVGITTEFNNAHLDNLFAVIDLKLLNLHILLSSTKSILSHKVWYLGHIRFQENAISDTEYVESEQCKSEAKTCPLLLTTLRGDNCMLLAHKP